MALPLLLIVYDGLSGNKQRLDDWAGFAFAYGHKASYAPQGKIRLEPGYEVKDITQVAVIDVLSPEADGQLYTSLKKEQYQNCIIDFSQVEQDTQSIKAYLKGLLGDTFQSHPSNL